MFPASVKAILLLSIVLLAGGCDPETVIKAKVPPAIKDLLTFETKAPAKQALALESSLKIKSPKPDQVFPVNKDVVFQAELNKESEKAPQPEIVWKAVAEKEGRSQDVGQGFTAAKRLRPGNYRAELHATLGEKKVVKKVNFRVSFMISGKVTSKDGGGLAQTDIELIDLKEQKVVSATRSRGDGSFTLELPAEADYRVVARKERYLMSPQSRVISSPKDGPLQFSAQKGDITEIRLTETEESEENLRSLCPSQTVFLKCKIQLDGKPSSLQVFLVNAKNREQSLSFDPKEWDNLEEHTDASGITKLKITAPPASALGPAADAYAIRIRVADAKRESYVVESFEPIAVEYARCFRARLETAVNLQQNGNDAEAIKLYSLMEDMFNAIYDISPFSEVMDKAIFNRGLAYLKMALDEDDSATRLSLLNKSIQDFNRFLKARKSDAQAYMLRGAAYLAKADYKAADKDFDTSVELLPQLGPAFELRAQVGLKTGTKKGLLSAIDDYTEALEIDPGDKVVREARKEATKLAAGIREEADDRKVDASQVVIRPLKEWLNLPKYLRK